MILRFDHLLYFELVIFVYKWNQLAFIHTTLNGNFQKFKFLKDLSALQYGERLLRRMQANTLGVYAMEQSGFSANFRTFSDFSWTHQ